MNKGLGHFNSLGNVYLQPLEDANRAHLTARAKYCQLTELLKSSGCKFEDIKNFLLNQAKRSNLYRKNHYSPKDCKFTYSPLSKIKSQGWYVAIDNYTRWLKANYTAYGVEVVKKPKKKAVKVVVRKDAKGNVVKSETVTSKGTTSKGIKEVMDELSPSQVMAILQDNWAVLGQFCQERGATEEFNKLMLKLG